MKSPHLVSLALHFPRELTGLILLPALLLLPAFAAESVPVPITIASDLQLLVDRSLVAGMAGAALVQHAPQFAGVALKSDRPWEGDTLYVSSIFRIHDEYRMLYRGVDKRTDSETYHLCLAISRDGITWEKPSLGLIDFDGSTDNNIVADGHGQRIGMCYTFFDPRPEVAEDERVKAMIWTNGKKYFHAPSENESNRRLILLGSADGRVFRELSVQPKLHSDWPNAFDGGSIFWSEVEQTFVGYFRWWDEHPVPHARLLQDWMIVRPGVRSVFRTTSRDLVDWTRAEPMSYGESPREHIYENATYPYFRSPKLYLSLANRFNPGRRALTLEEEQKLKIRTVPDSHGRRLSFANDANDIILFVSKPGSLGYDRPFMEAFMRPGLDLGNWVSRSNYPELHGGLFQTGDTEMSFLVTRQHFQAGNHLERMCLRLDGFASMNGSYAGGEFVTVPVVYQGDHLELNYSTSAAGEVRVELQDASGRALPGFTLDDCDPIIGDRIAGQVTWRGRRSLSSYVGVPVRLRIRLVDADLYSFRFGSSEK